MNAFATWWDAPTPLKAYIDANLGQPVVTARGVFAGNVVENETAALTVSTGLAMELPGVSFRCPKTSSRPLGGRRGAMYWPGAENSAHDGDGVLTTGVRTAIDAALTQLLTDIESSSPGVYIAQRHVLDGEESFGVVTDIGCDNTVSFLNRRYR